MPTRARFECHIGGYPMRFVAPLTVALLIGIATPALAAHPLEGKICTIQFGKADNPNQDAIGSFVLDFSTKKTTPILRKMGREALQSPWDGKGSKPEDYANAGTATLSQTDPTLVEMSWLGRTRSIRLTDAAKTGKREAIIKQLGSMVEVPASVGC